MKRIYDFIYTILLGVAFVLGTIHGIIEFIYESVKEEK